jgi:hypothetical protein
MVTIGDDVVVKYTLSGKIVERFSIGRDKLHLTARAPLSRRGEVVGGPFWSPAVACLSVHRDCVGMMTPRAGDQKGPPLLIPSPLAPTDQPASCLSLSLRLMPIGCHSRLPCSARTCLSFLNKTAVSYTL